MFLKARSIDEGSSTVAARKEHTVASSTVTRQEEKERQWNTAVNKHEAKRKYNTVASKDTVPTIKEEKKAADIIAKKEATVARKNSKELKKEITVARKEEEKLKRKNSATIKEQKKAADTIAKKEQEDTVAARKREDTVVIKEKKLKRRDTVVAMTCSETASIPPPKSPESATSREAPKRRALYAATRAFTTDAVRASIPASPAPLAVTDATASVAPKRRGGIAQAASFASRRVMSIVSSFERSFDQDRKVEEVKKAPTALENAGPREKRRYGGSATATRFLHGIAEREQEMARREREQEEEDRKKKEEEARKAATESLASRTLRRGRSVLSAVNGRRLEPLLEGVPIIVDDIPETKLKKAKKYTGAATTGKIGEILARGRVDETGNIREQKVDLEEERRHLVGFTHRKSHLSLSSQLSGSASFYLIGEWNMKQTGLSNEKEISQGLAKIR